MFLYERVNPQSWSSFLLRLLLQHTLYVQVTHVMLRWTNVLKPQRLWWQLMSFCGLMSYLSCGLQQYAWRGSDTEVLLLLHRCALWGRKSTCRVRFMLLILLLMSFSVDTTVTLLCDNVISVKLHGQKWLNLMFWSLSLWIMWYFKHSRRSELN